MAVYADWCAPCKAIAPLYEQLSSQISKSGVVAFLKVNTETQKEIATAYRVSSIPTFMMFRDGNKIDEVKGADPRKLQSIVEKLTSEIRSVSGGAVGSSSSAGGNSALGWRGAELPRGYSDVTDQIEIQKSELLNYDEDFGAVRQLVDASKPGGLSGGKMAEKDWVVSDTDEQLLLFTPFMSSVKLHTLQVRAFRSSSLLSSCETRLTLTCSDHFYQGRGRGCHATSGRQAFYQQTPQPWIRGRRG